jgi:hypothetical protein
LLFFYTYPDKIIAHKPVLTNVNPYLMKLEYSSSLRYDCFGDMMKMKTGSLSEISAIIYKSSNSVRTVATVLTDRLFL